MDDGLQVIGVRVSLYDQSGYLGTATLPWPVEPGDARQARARPAAARGQRPR